MSFLRFCDQISQVPLTSMLCMLARMHACACWHCAKPGASSYVCVVLLVCNLQAKQQLWNIMAVLRGRSLP